MKITIFIKEHIMEAAAGTFAGGVGTASTFVIDWNHIAERAVETIILAVINGSAAAVAGFVSVYFVKKFFKKLS